MRVYLLAAAAAAITLAAAPASAQFGVYVGPGGGGVYVDPDRGPSRHYDDGYDDWRISRREAVRIARRNGMREVYDVDRRGPYWVVRGENFRGRRVSMRIHRNGDWGWY